MLEFLDRQVDKITLLVAVALFGYGFCWMIHWKIEGRWIEGVWGAILLILGALLREVGGSISSAIKSLNGKNGAAEVKNSLTK